MKTKSWAVLIFLVAFGIVSRSALAHHGTANFEMDHFATIKGVVVDYQLINPHVEMTLKVTQDDGKVVEWNVEGVSLNMMMRAGFRRDSMKVGDTVTVTGRPGKNGKAMMLLTKIILADGQELSAPYE